MGSDGKKVNHRANAALIGGAALLTVPQVVVRLLHVELPETQTVAVTGAAILGAAFLISWAAELAQYDVSRSLAMALLALIAVLPEYAVDVYLAWRAAVHPQYIPLVAANMTGANRLLVGLGWSAVIVLGWLALRRLGRLPAHRGVPIHPHLTIEFTCLTAATLYSFVLPLKATICTLDSVVLISLFAAYMWLAGKAPHAEPDPAGPVAVLCLLPKLLRRAACVLLFLYSAVVILISTEPFTEGLITLGKNFGISQFLLIQWLAPLASEAPEMIIVCYFAVRGHVASALSAIVSSKVNQWTLLIGSLPVVFSLSAGRIGHLPLHPRPREEVLLTAAQSLFACSIAAKQRFTRYDAVLLFVLFASQLVIPGLRARYIYALVYFALGIAGFCLFHRQARASWQRLIRIARGQPIADEET